MHTTVKELVMKHNSMSEKLKELFQVISKMQGEQYAISEVIERAEKDQRYPVMLLVNEYKRIKADMQDLEDMPVRILHD